VSIEGSHKSGREKCLKAVLEVLQQPLPFLKVWHIMKNILEGRVGTGWNHRRLEELLLAGLNSPNSAAFQPLSPQSENRRKHKKHGGKAMMTEIILALLTVS